MIVEQLYIEGQLVDIIPNKVTRSLQIGKLGDIADRESNYSNTIKLPLTSHNMDVFDDLGIVGNLSRKQYRRLSCRYVVDGIVLISDGYCVIQNLTDAYEVVLYDGIIDLGEKIKDKDISELNYSDINHFVAEDNFINNIENTQYIYALGDFGVPFNEDGSIQSERLAPCIYIAELWDRIFKQNGFNYSGDFFNENEHFRTELLAPGKGYDVIDVDFEQEELGNATSSYIRHNTTSTSPINIEERYSWEAFNMQDATYNSDTNEIEFNVTGQVQIKVKADTRMGRGSGGGSMFAFIIFKLNGEVISKKEIPQQRLDDLEYVLNIPVSQGDKLTAYLASEDNFAARFDDPDFEEDWGDYNSGGDWYYGDYAYVTYENEMYQEEQYQASIYNVDCRAVLDLDFIKISGGQPILFEEIVPELGQLELVKDVVQRYGLLIRPIKNTNTFEFIQFEKLLNDVGNAEDWSDKYIATKEEKYSTSYGINNIATYKYSSDVEIPTHDGKITIDVDTLKDTSTIFSSPYTISTFQTTLDEQEVYQVPIWEQDDEGFIENKETNPRIFRLGRHQHTIYLKYFGGNTSTLNEYLPFLTLDNLSMQFFLGQYYKAFSGIINTYKEIDMDLWLNEIDIYDLNFFRLKYLKQYGKYFYLNKLRHSAGETSTGTLIEINDFKKNLPPTQLTNVTITIPAKTEYLLTTEELIADYMDPELDGIKSIKITGGFSNTDVIMKLSRQIVTSTVTLDARNGELPTLRIADLGKRIGENHTAIFTYDIMDEGSGQFSGLTGTITVNVLEFVNEPPVIWFWHHGTTYTMGEHVVRNEDGEIQDYFWMNLWAGTEDGTGIIVDEYFEILEKPNQSTVYFNDAHDGNSQLIVPLDDVNVGTYRLRFHVIDEYGAETTRDTGDILVLPRVR